MENYHRLERRSRCIEIKKHEGEPSDRAIRLALSEVFYGMARAIEKEGSEEEFMPIFPVRLTIESVDNKWDFTIFAKIENKHAVESDALLAEEQSCKSSS